MPNTESKSSIPEERSLYVSDPSGVLPFVRVRLSPLEAHLTDRMNKLEQWANRLDELLERLKWAAVLDERVRRLERLGQKHQIGEMQESEWRLSLKD